MTDHAPQPRRVLRVLGLALVAGVSGLGLGGCGSQEGEGAPVSTASTSASLLSSADRIAESSQQETIDIATLGYDVGDVRAPIRVVEFSDFGCGYCRKFHEETFPTLQSEFIDAGKVYWKYVPFVIGMFPHGDEAGLAGECAAEQGRFEQMRDLLFQEQPTWKPSDDARPHLRRYGEELGLDVEEYWSCVENEKPADRLRTARRAAQALGIRGTPTFFINGYPVQGALPLELFQNVFNAEIERLESAAGSTGG